MLQKIVYHFCYKVFLVSKRIVRNDIYFIYQDRTANDNYLSQEIVAMNFNGIFHAIVGGLLFIAIQVIGTSKISETLSWILLGMTLVSFVFIDQTLSKRLKLANYVNEFKGYPSRKKFIFNSIINLIFSLPLIGIVSLFLWSTK